MGFCAPVRMMGFLLTPLREGRRSVSATLDGKTSISTHAPAGGATSFVMEIMAFSTLFLLTPLREGRRKITEAKEVGDILFLLTPLREGRPGVRAGRAGGRNFYSRPCGRGDFLDAYSLSRGENFYSRPCGRGDTAAKILLGEEEYFYSRPCGRGDGWQMQLSAGSLIFLLTPLREGRRK